MLLRWDWRAGQEGCWDPFCHPFLVGLSTSKIRIPKSLKSTHSSQASTAVGATDYNQLTCLAVRVNMVIKRINTQDVLLPVKWSRLKLNRKTAIRWSYLHHHKSYTHRISRTHCFSSLLLGDRGSRKFRFLPDSGSIHTVLSQSCWHYIGASAIWERQLGRGRAYRKAPRAHHSRRMGCLNVFRTLRLKCCQAKELALWGSVLR